MSSLSKKIKSSFVFNLILFSILALAISNFVILAALNAKAKHIISVLINNYFVSSNNINELINKLVTSPFISHITVLRDGIIYKELTGLSDSYNYIITKTFFGKNASYDLKLFISLPDLLLYLYKKFIYVSILLVVLFDIFFLIFYRTIVNNVIKPLEILFKNIKERRIGKLISIKNKEFFEAQKELEELFSTIRISQQKVKFVTDILEVLARSQNFKEDFEKLLDKLIKDLPQVDGFILVKKEGDDGLLVKVYDKGFKKEFKIDKESFSLYAFNLINPKLIGEVDKLNILSEEEKEIGIKDAYVIPVNLFTEKIGAFVVYSKGKLLLSEIEREFFKLLGFTIFLALVLDEVYKEAKNIEKVKADYLAQSILNYLNILENRYVYGYKTQRIVNIISSLEEKLKELNIDIEKLKKASIYMNLGLFMMPDKITLNFEEDLEEKEKSLYEIHPIISSIFLNNLKTCDPEVKQAVLDHHENVDGSGFPSQKKKDEISIYAKVLRILDDFDSLTTKENKEKALEILKENKGKYYDEDILEKLLPELEKIEIKEETILPDEILELHKEVLNLEKNSLNIKFPKSLEKEENNISSNNSQEVDSGNSKNPENSEEDRKDEGNRL